MTSTLLITIDGPAGAGKTTVSRLLADRLGYRYIDTGALYRGIACELLRAEVDPDDDEGLTRMCRTLSISMEHLSNALRLYVNGRDVTDQLRLPEVGMMASTVSAKPVVRKLLLNLQRRIGEGKSVVFEGRDMGTVVFPNADVKFYLDASLEVRAQRRFRELSSIPLQNFEAVKEDMAHRDAKDRLRAISPLRPAEDAIVIDSTHISADQVVARMMAHIRKSMKQFSR